MKYTKGALVAGGLAAVLVGSAAGVISVASNYREGIALGTQEQHSKCQVTGIVYVPFGNSDRNRKHSSPLVRMDEDHPIASVLDHPRTLDQYITVLDCDSGGWMIDNKKLFEEAAFSNGVDLTFVPAYDAEILYDNILKARLIGAVPIEVKASARTKLISL